MCSPSVIPAKAGIQLFRLLIPPGPSWMPACAGMTRFSLYQKAMDFKCPQNHDQAQPPGAAGTAESRATGTSAGRNVCMKATRAVTSCGARFLP
jgi:hypothetical protein